MPAKRTRAFYVKAVQRYFDTMDAGDVDGCGSCALNGVSVEAHNATVKLRRGVFTMSGCLADEHPFYPPFSIKSVL